MRDICKTYADLFTLASKASLLEKMIGGLTEEDEGHPNATYGLYYLAREVTSGLMQLNKDFGPISGLIEQMQTGQEVQLPDSELIFRPVEADLQAEA